MHFESGAPLKLAVDRDEPVVLADNSVDGGETETGTEAILLSGEEWLEDLCDGLV